MASNLIDLAKEFLTPDLISRMSGMVGETPAVTKKTMEVVVPSLAGAAYQQVSTPGGADHVLELMSSTNADSNFLSKLTGLFKGGNLEGITRIGGGLTSGLLGSNVGRFTSAISRASGISDSSASTFLNLGAPIVFGALGSMVPAGGVSPMGLTNIVAAERNSIIRQAPAEVTSLLGIGQGRVFDAPEPFAGPFVTKERRSNPWLWMIPILGLILAFLVWRSFSGRPALQLQSLNLPCGTVIQVEQGGFDDGVAKFMMNGSPNDLPKRFTFDHLNFTTDSAQVTADSNGTISNLISTAKCFPDMQVALVGYTDNTGDPAANKKLSLDRANAVKAMLVQGGIDANRISSEGGGQENPVAGNDTEEGRAKNRRTELVVTKMK